MYERAVCEDFVSDNVVLVSWSLANCSSIVSHLNFHPIMFEGLGRWTVVPEFPAPFVAIRFNFTFKAKASPS